MHAELSYSKLILAKVSFDSLLFRKELKKALTVLLPTDVEMLKSWCYIKFGQQHRSVLDECFSQTRLN
ncbi:hypothetical protein P0M28_09445 [Tunicatimonas pelagia]|nr:hypothetical protein [Tunicatimonas pelagia]WKN46332.1 hypothetical protein P0M28_09445 [Tunicatimonas pelagia]